MAFHFSPKMSKLFTFLPVEHAESSEVAHFYPENNLNDNAISAETGFIKLFIPLNCTCNEEEFIRIYIYYTSLRCMCMRLCLC